MFLIDVAHSAQLVARLRTFAQENDVVVKYESIKAHIKAHIQSVQRKASHKYYFFRPFRSDRSLSEHLKEMYTSFEKQRSKRK